MMSIITMLWFGICTRNTHDLMEKRRIVAVLSSTKCDSFFYNNYAVKEYIDVHLYGNSTNIPVKRFLCGNTIFSLILRINNNSPAVCTGIIV